MTDRHDRQATFRVWTRGHYQKPTGMLCRGGTIFLAVQDLDSHSYDSAPAATIAASTDAGATFREPPVPMFLDGIFTTIMFLDQGPDGRDAQDAYVYAYGLDFNWRGSQVVTSPQALYLARVAPGKVMQDRSQWEFFAGDAGTVTWTPDIASKKPVLVDCTRRHASADTPGYPVIAQGGVVYDAPLARYLYTSWSENTCETLRGSGAVGPVASLPDQGLRTAAVDPCQAWRVRDQRPVALHQRRRQDAVAAVEHVLGGRRPQQPGATSRQAGAEGAGEGAPRVSSPPERSPASIRRGPG